MKILLIYNKYRYSGGEDTYFSSVRTLLQQKGHSVITFTKSSLEISSKIKTGVNMFFNPRLLEELKNLIRGNKPDIVQIQNIYPTMNASIYNLIHSFHIPIVQRISNYRYVCPKMSLFRDGKVCTDCVGKKIAYPSVIHRCYAESRLASLGFSLSHSFYSAVGAYSKINAYLFPSQFIREYNIKNNVVEKKKTHVIPSFYLPLKKYPVVPEKNYILFIGRLTEEKGIDLLLQTMQFIPYIKLVVIGEGPLSTLVVNLSRVNKNIIYKGQLSSKVARSYIQNSEFVVIPSRWYDVLPNVLIESFAMAKPVIAPHFGVFPELIVHKENGLLYEYNNIKDLSKKISRLYINKNMIKKLGENAYEMYKRKYTAEFHYKNLMKLYKNLLP